MGKEQRGMAYLRHVRNKTILKKKHMNKSVYRFDWYHYEGQYSKGKIHCGCGLCKHGKKYRLPITKNVREMLREKIIMFDYEIEQQMIVDVYIKRGLRLVLFLISIN